MSTQLLKGTVIFSVAAVVTAGLNFVFYTIGRIIGVEQFGILIALISLAYVITIVQNVIVSLTTKAVAGNTFNIKSFVEKLSPWILKAQLAFAVGFILFAILFLQGFLKLESVVPFLALATLLSVAFLISMHRGILNGRKQYREVAISQIIEAVFKVSLAFAAVTLGFGVSGILIGVTLGTMVSFIYLRRETSKIETKGKVVLKKLFPKRLTASIGTSFVVLSLMFLVDSVIARNTLSSSQAGLYGGVITFGKLVFFLANSVVLALFPLSSSKSHGREILFQGVAMVVIIGAASFVAFHFFGRLATAVIFGEQFAGIPAYLPLEALIMTVFSTLNVIAAYLLGKDRHSFAAILLLGLIVQVGALMIWGKSIEAILQIQSIVMASLLVVSFFYLLLVGKIYEKK